MASDSMCHAECMILVTGATGFIGSHTVRALRARGLEVRALVRPSADVASLNTLGVDLIRGDLLDPQILKQACTGVEQIIHIVGIIREIPPKVTFERIHIEGIRGLLAAAQAQGVGRFIYISAIGARPNARARYHQTKWAAEEMVRASGLAWTILRPSVVFGPGDDFINLLANDLVKTPPFIPVIGSGENKLQPLWVKDLAEVICQCSLSANTAGQTYELGGPQQLSLRAILEILANHLKVRKPFVNIPLGLVTPAVALGTAIVPQLLPITSDQLTMLQEDNVTAQEPFKADFVLQPLSLAEGIPEYL